jgi:hypothetical protein
MRTLAALMATKPRNPETTKAKARWRFVFSCVRVFVLSWLILSRPLSTLQSHDPDLISMCR